jgi:gamma-glutamylaminecyclotransferase
MTLIFVFGTLEEGFPNFETNRGRRVSGEYKTETLYPHYLGGERHSPWLLDSPGQGVQVHGQVFEVNDETLKQMDILERVHEPDGYVRKVVKIIAASGVIETPLEVDAYLKRGGALAREGVRAGPLTEYLLEHAKLYRPRML